MSETTKTVVSVAARPAVAAQRAPARAYAREETTAETTTSPIAEGDKSRSLAARLFDDLTPPEPLTIRPHTPVEVWRYARHGAWADPDRAPTRDGGRQTKPAARVAAIAYGAMVAVPATAAFGYLTWAIAPKPAAPAGDGSKVVRAIEVWTPPHWSAIRPPAPVEVWRYARSATAPGARVYGYAAAAWTTVCAYALWVLARPSRAVVAAALTGLWLL